MRGTRGRLKRVGQLYCARPPVRHFLATTQLITVSWFMKICDSAKCIIQPRAEYKFSRTGQRVAKWQHSGHRDQHFPAWVVGSGSRVRGLAQRCCTRLSQLSDRRSPFSPLPFSSSTPLLPKRRPKFDVDIRTLSAILAHAALQLALWQPDHPRHRLSAVGCALRARTLAGSRTDVQNPGGEFCAPVAFPGKNCDAPAAGQCAKMARRCAKTGGGVLRIYAISRQKHTGIESHPPTPSLTRQSAARGGCWNRARGSGRGCRAPAPRG